MKRSALVVSAALVVVWAGAARAHLGATVAVLKFNTPLDPGVTHADVNDTLTQSPFTWTSADASYVVTWNDGDTDPTGRFTFYYMDHQPTFQVGPGDIETGGIATKVDDGAGINANGGYFASCYCSGDQGVTCPSVTRDPNGNCANQLTWNTSKVAPGTYWLVAVDNDPPYYVYYVADAPVRIAHGGAPMPAALVMRPDGFGAWDTSYHAQWLADGKAPLTFGLAFGLEDTGTSLMPQTQLFAGMTIPANSDGTFSYDWDVSQLPTNKMYWLRLTVTDADGHSTFTDSRFAVSVYHPGTTGPAPDLSTAPPPKKKSGCEIGEAPARGTRSLVSVLAALALAVYVARRAARRSPR